MRRKNNKKQNKKKQCPLKAAGFKKEDIDYKNVELLKNFITEGGKIYSRRITGVSAKFQKIIAKAVKRARSIALLPFSNKY